LKQLLKARTKASVYHVNGEHNDFEKSPEKEKQLKISQFTRNLPLLYFSN